MARYCSDSDSESDSFDDEDEQEYSNIDFGVFSAVSYSHPSVYGAAKRRGSKRMMPVVEEEEEDIYDTVEGVYDNSVEELYEGYRGYAAEVFTAFARVL